MSDEDASGSGEQKGLDRILALSDGVFAFAITLLVLGLAVPAITLQTSSSLLVALSKESSSFYSYAISFVVISVWWVAHHRLFRYITKYDSALLWINLAFLLFITIIPFLTELLNKYGNIVLAVVIYDVSQILGGLALSILWRYATNKHLLTKSLIPAQIRNIRIRGYVPMIAFLLAIAVAFALPKGVDPSDSMFVLFVMFPLMRFASRKKITSE